MRVWSGSTAGRLISRALEDIRSLMATYNQLQDCDRLIFEYEILDWTSSFVVPLAAEGKVNPNDAIYAIFDA